MTNIDKQAEIRIIVGMGNTPEHSLTISDVMSQYLQMVERSRSKHTMLTYRNALHIFSELLEKNSLKPDITPITNLTEDLFKKFVGYLHDYAAATEQLYLQAVKGFYLFVDAEKLIQVSQSRLTVLIRQRSRRPGIRLPQFPADDIERLLNQVEDVGNLAAQASVDVHLETENSKVKERAIIIPEGKQMVEKEVERIEKIINEAVESAWEEAKLRDLMNLYLM